MKRYLMMILVAIAAVALFGAACGGGDDDSSSGSEPTSAADSGDGDSGDGDSGDGDSGDGDSGDASDGDSGDSGDGDAGDGGLSAVLSAAASLGSENSYKITYQITSEGGSDGVLDGIFTIASDPPNQLFQIEGTFDGEELKMTMITDEDSSVICVEETGEPGVCISLGAGGSSPFPLPTFLDAPAFIGSFTTADGVSVSSAGSENIAGQSATCYDVNSAEGDVRVCVADDGGQMLSVEVDDGEMKFKMVVIEFGSPSAADFEPPFDVIDFG